MALVKSVEIDIGVKGDTASKAKLDAISVRAEELKKAFPEYTLKIDSLAASQKLAVFKADMKSVAAEVSKPMDTVVLTADAKKKLLEVQAKAEELKGRFPELHLEIDDSAAKRKLAIFAAEAKATTDAVDAEMATAGGGGRSGILGKITGLFGGGGGAASSGGGAASGGGLLSSPAGIGGIAGGGLLAAGLVPGAVGLGIGGAVGLGAIAGGLFGASQGTTVLKADTATIKQITTGLKTAIGNQKKILSADLVAANKQFAKDSNFFAPFLGFQKSLKSLLQVFLAPLRSVMGPLTQIFAQFGKGLTLLGPLMTQMFKASLPFIRQFLTVMLQAGKILMPAFTQAMTEMVKSGALKQMTQGLVYLVQGLAGFVVALGPGMKASSQIFERICLVIKGAMIGVGVVVSAVANILELNWPAAVARMRHDVASSFDALRHDVSSIWDKMWANTLGRLQRGIADDQRLVANFRHAVAGTFDALRHDIAAVWDTIWSNTVTRVRGGISAVVGWFAGLPRRAVGALTGLGHSLAAFASAAINQMWTGFKNTFSAVIHWFTGLPKMILHALGIKSPPGWAISAGKFIMQGLHIGLGHGLGQLTNFTTGIGAKVAQGLAGGFPGGAPKGPVQDYAKKLLSLYGWGGQFGSLNALIMGESGWNPLIVNQSSGAYGIPQALPGSKMAAAGSDWRTSPYTQLRWMFGYLKSVYGSPANAYSTWLGRSPHWYDKGGWLMPGLTLAMNKTGRPERVLPPGHSGTVTPVVLQVRTAHGATNLDRALVEIIQKFVTVQGGDVQSALGRT